MCFLSVKDFDSYYSYVEDSQDHRSKYSKEANEARGSRKKREDSTRIHFPANRTVCNMYLKVDPKFYREIYRNEGNQVRYLTKYLVVFFLFQHFKISIYLRTMT